MPSCGALSLGALKGGWGSLLHAAASPPLQHGAAHVTSVRSADHEPATGSKSIFSDIGHNFMISNWALIRGNFQFHNEDFIGLYSQNTSLHVVQKSCHSWHTRVNTDVVLPLNTIIVLSYDVFRTHCEIMGKMLSSFSVSLRHSRCPFIILLSLCHSHCLFVILFVLLSFWLSFWYS